MPNQEPRLTGSHYVYQGGRVGVCHCGPANVYTGPQFVTLDDLEAVARWEARA